MLLISLNDLCHYCIVITDSIPLLTVFSLTFIYSVIPEHSSILRMLKYSAYYNDYICHIIMNKSYYNDKSKTWIPTDQYFSTSFYR